MTITFTPRNDPFAGNEYAVMLDGAEVGTVTAFGQNDWVVFADDGQCMPGGPYTLADAKRLAGTVAHLLKSDSDAAYDAVCKAGISPRR